MARYGRLWLLMALMVAATMNGHLAAKESADSVFYLVPFSHLDFFWGGTREECVSRGNRIIAKAIQLAKESPQFRFLLEDDVFVANFVDSHRGAPEVEDLQRLVKEGRIEVAPKWTGIFQELPDGEVHARNMAIGKRYAKDVFGVDAQVSHLGDLPGYTPQFPQVLEQSRVPYAVITRMGPSDKSAFFWTAPNGSKVLAWNALKGYGWGTFLTSKTASFEEKRTRFLKDLADVQKTTDGPILMHWGTDLWAPPDDLVATMEAFFKAVQAKLIFATPSDFFHRLEKSPSLPEVSGEIPSSWPNIGSSLVHIWPGIIPATNTLLAAEKFAAINYALGYADYPQQEFDFLWKKLVESMDHNHNGQGGTIGDNRKIEYMRLAAIQGGEILRDRLRNIAERVQVPIPDSFPIVVFNPLGWDRNDVVRAHVTLYGKVGPADLGAFRKGLRLLDEKGNSVPFHLAEWSENISRAVQLVFVARGVPSLGYKTYYVVAAEKPEAYPPAAVVKLDSDNDRREPRRPLGSDVLENGFYRLTVDRAAGRVTLFDKDLNRDVCRGMEIIATEERGGNYIGVEPLSGRTIPSLVDRIILEENNPVRAVVRIDSRIADILITQRLTLYQELKQLDVENTVEWKTLRLVRIEQCFPLPQQNGAIHYGVPFGASAADNLMPKTGPHAGDEIKYDSWKNARLIHDWIHAGTAEGDPKRDGSRLGRAPTGETGPVGTRTQSGLTIASDHQQFRLGEGLICAEMVRGTRFVSVKVVHGDEVGSLQYPPAGTYVFRYSLSSASGDWKAAKAYRAGLAWNNPLLPISVADDITGKSLPPTRSFCSLKEGNLVLSALKKADRDPSILLRVYEMEGAPAQTPVEFLGRTPAFGEVNLLEEDLDQTPPQTLRVPPYAIKTIKLGLDRRGP